ncbi:UBX domain [Sergentomyia squamirostris]
MSNQSVTVLTPSARRHTVKLGPNTTLLQVLEQTCEKYKLDSNRHELKHHNKTVDLSAMFRFSGLPNNSLLEMVETSKVRRESAMEIVIQTESGDRLSGTFRPENLLHEILQELCPDHNQNAVIIYMRKEIFGEELKKTQLRSLGLTGGKAMLRLMHRNPEELKVQANVSAPLLPKVNPVPAEDRFRISTERTLRDLNVPGSSTEEPMQIEEHQEDVEKPQASLEDKSQEHLVENSPESKKLKFEVNSKKEDAISAEEMKKLEEEIKIIGDNDAVIFSLDSAQRVQERDLPDSFFDLTIDDVRLLLRDLKDQVKSLDDAPLMTAKLRDMENDQKILKLLQYKKTVIRIQFPDRHVLQATFNPIDTIETVTNLVRKHLEDPNLSFHLFTTPPKEILPLKSRLVELKCVPQAVIHFGVEEEDTKGNFLKQDHLQNLTSADAAILLAMRSRGLSYFQVPERQMEDTDMQAVGEASTSKPRIPENFQKSSSSSSSKTPKWFKLSK